MTSSYEQQTFGWHPGQSYAIITGHCCQVCCVSVLSLTANYGQASSVSSLYRYKQTRYP